MGFSKLILDFYKSCNVIRHNHFGPYLKNQTISLTQDLELEFQGLLLKT